MKKSTKALLLTLCAVALVAGTLFGTLAYLTDSESATNTFTVGKVQISLDEAKVDENGKALADGTRTETGNAYHLLPGGTYDKDPTVTVLANSEESYVRMIVTVEGIERLKAAIPAEKNPTYYNGDVFLLQMLVNGWDNNVWQFVKYENGKYEFRHVGTVAKNTVDTKLPALFTEINVPGFVDNDGIANLANVKIHVEAHAIQAAGFTSADTAWAAFAD